MSLDLAVRGDPDACWTAAAALHLLGEAQVAAAATLAGQSRLDEDGFGGRAGDAFRARARRLARSADLSAGRCLRLARALDDLASGLAEAGHLMALARRAAEGHLVVVGDEIRPPVADRRSGEPWSAAAWRAWDAAVETAAAGRRVEAVAQQAWRTAVDALDDLPASLG